MRLLRTVSYPIGKLAWLWNLREEVVNNVELDDTVEQLTTNKSKVSVNSGQSTLLESPGALLKVLSLFIVVVEVGDGNFIQLARIFIKFSPENNSPSQWLTQR